jgi:hypothetical protein
LWFWPGSLSSPEAHLVVYLTSVSMKSGVEAQ